MVYTVTVALVASADDPAPPVDGGRSCKSRKFYDFGGMDIGGRERVEQLTSGGGGQA